MKLNFAKLVFGLLVCGAALPALTVSILTESAYAATAAPVSAETKVVGDAIVAQLAVVKVDSKKYTDAVAGKTGAEHLAISANWAKAILKAEKHAAVDAAVKAHGEAVTAAAADAAKKDTACKTFAEALKALLVKDNFETDDKKYGPTVKALVDPVK